MSIREYIKRRRIRKLAEKCLMHQIVYSDSEIRSDLINNSIQTAMKFYEVWDAMKESKNSYVRSQGNKDRR